MKKLRVNLMLTEANYKRLQHRALDEETSVSAIVDKLIEGYLKTAVRKAVTNMAINKTKAGTFEVDFRDQYKKRHLKTFDTHKEAVAFEKEVKAQVSKREYVPPTNTLLKDAAVSWYNSAGDGYCRGTLIYWKNHIDNYIVPSLGHLKITR